MLGAPLKLSLRTSPKLDNEISSQFESQCNDHLRLYMAPNGRDSLDYYHSEVTFVSIRVPVASADTYEVQLTAHYNARQPHRG